MVVQRSFLYFSVDFLKPYNGS